MSFEKRISKAFQDALHLPLTPHSRYILFSDCHRGIGNANDNFLKNEFLYLAALDYYFRQNFTYLELGDGDELWENRSVCRIKAAHERTLALLARYYTDGRLYAVYGNHDIVKRNPSYLKKHFHSYFCGEQACEFPLFPDITFYSGIILQDSCEEKDIYLTHGHQADLLNSTFWRLSRFLVRYVWKPLEKFGIPDPTSAAKNNTRKKKSEQLLCDWARENHHILIAGHTHHPMAGSPDSPYFNTGSCVSPSGITGIEIENRCVTLVKWSIGTRQDMTMYAAREVLGETICVDELIPA